VPEPIGGRLELDGDERRLGVEELAELERLVDPLLTDDLRQELVEDDPLVVPAGELTCAFEDLMRVAGTLLADHVHGVVVKLQERRV